MWLKKFLSIVLVVVSINCFSIIVSAFNVETDVDEEIIDEYQIAVDPGCTLGISGSKATYTSSTFTTGGIRITVEHSLQKHWGLWIWNEVAGSTESRSVNRNDIFLCSTKSGLESGTYRVKSTFTMTNRSGQTETITIYSSEETVS